MLLCLLFASGLFDFYPFFLHIFASFFHPGSRHFNDARVNGGRECDTLKVGQMAYRVCFYMLYMLPLFYLKKKKKILAFFPLSFVKHIGLPLCMEVCVCK